MQILTIDYPDGAGLRLALALCAERQPPCMALNFELAQEEAAPEWVQLLPPGQIITGRDGRTWINDRPEQLVAAFAAEGKDLPIDWEHSTQLKAPHGAPSPAAGWIKEIEERDGGLWGRVEWTVKGGASIVNREYRYLSPVFHYEMETNRIFRIVSAGLTNQPNLHLEALNQEQERDMQLARLLALLALPATATFDEALNSIGTLQTNHATALNQAQNPPIDKFVPIDQYKTALNRAETAENGLKSVKQAELETAINTEIDAALQAGKITPATKEYYTAQCRQEGGLEKFREFIKVAPAVAGATDLDNKDPNRTDTALNAEQQQIAAMFGNSSEDIKKYGSA